MTNPEIEEKLLALADVYKKEEEELASAENCLLDAELLLAEREASLIGRGADGKNEQERKAWLYRECLPSHHTIAQDTKERNIRRAWRDGTLREIRILTAILNSRGAVHVDD